MEQETRFAHQFEKLSPVDTFESEETSVYEIRNDFKDIRTKAFIIRSKIYVQDIKQRGIQNYIQLKCNDNVVQSLKPENIDVANKSIDEKTRKFSTLSKRIQRDRQHCNYSGYFENHIKDDANENITATLYRYFKRFLKNFKAHRYKEYFLKDSATKPNKTTKSPSPSKYSIFSLRKRRKKKSFVDYIEHQEATIYTLNTPVERKINSIDICNSQCGTDTNRRLSKGLNNGRCHSNKTITNRNKLEDKNERKHKTTKNGHNRITDITYNITCCTGVTVDRHEEKANCNKENCRKSNFNTSLCYYFHSFIHRFGSRNKVVSYSDRRHQTYMIMNFEKSDFKPEYKIKPTTLLSAKAAKPHLKEIENSRNYRLSSYLAERHWMAKQNEYNNYLRSGLQTLLSVSECEFSVPPVVRFFIYLTSFM